MYLISKVEFVCSFLEERKTVSKLSHLYAHTLFKSQLKVNREDFWKSLNFQKNDPPEIDPLHIRLIILFWIQRFKEATFFIFRT